MLNEQSIRQIFEPCGFKHRLISKVAIPKKQKFTPKEGSIKKVFDCINLHKTITKKNIMTKTGVSAPCLETCFDVLLQRGKIARTFIRFSGPYKVYTYHNPRKSNHG